MADGNPFASMLNPNAARIGLWDMRMMSAANRMETPFERGARGMYRGRGVSGDPMLAGLAGMANEPDYSQFTNDPRAQAAARQALAPYGLAPLEARDVKSNVLLPNTGFFGSHPRLSGALEGGIFGAAAAHGGETPGESIQGALEGMIGGQRIRRGLYNQQFARPFEAAGMMEQLQDMKQRRDLQEADIQHLRAENNKLGLPEHPMRSIGNAGPQDKFIPIYNNETGQVETQPNPNYDPALVEMSHRHAGAGTDFDRFIDMRNQERKAKGLPALNSEEVLGLRGRYMASGVAPGEAARQPYKNLAEAQKAHTQYIEGLQKQILKGNDLGDRQKASQLLAMERMSSGNFNPPSEKDIDAYIDQRNTGLQQQIQGANEDFNAQYPQTTALPPEGRSQKPAPKQSGKGTKDSPIEIH